MDTAAEIIETMMAMRDDRQAQHLMRFFKTRKGEYGEGDISLGLKVPQTRLIVKEMRADMPLKEVKTLLYSEWHEVRLAGFLLLVKAMKAATPKKNTDAMENALRRDEIVAFFLSHAKQANNGSSRNSGAFVKTRRIKC